MSRPIKTYSIEKLKNEINIELSRSDIFMTEEKREALCAFLEKILLKTNNYHGHVNIIQNNECKYQRKYL